MDLSEGVVFTSPAAGTGAKRGPSRSSTHSCSTEGSRSTTGPMNGVDPEDFDQAAVVVGAHGAGLANLAFCRRGTRVIEIIPTDNAHPFYYSLALAAQLDYGYLVGRSIVERDAGAFGPSPYDFDVDLDELAAALA